ncbi:MAG: GH3 auxin-responsive promoter family protein [Saprospiraceae bacterium]
MALAGAIVKKSIRWVEQKGRQVKIPSVQQLETLNGLLKKAEKTAFGKHYDFGRIQSQDTIQAFQEKVPIHDYDKMFDEWWHKSLHGQLDVCWPGKTKYFAVSSGTTGAATKYIPVTHEMLKAMQLVAWRMFTCLPKYDVPSHIFTKDWLMIGGTASLNFNGHCQTGDLSGILAKQPPIWLRKFYKPGPKAAKITTWEERLDYIAKNAHHWDIGIVTGTPSWIQLTLEKIIEYQHLDNIHQIWPNFGVYVTGGIAFEPYRKSFEKLVAQVPIYQDSYLASEGFLGYQQRPGTNAKHLSINNGIFFEFVPFNDAHFDENGNIKPDAKALTIEQVEEGVDYALLLSTCAGAWRYLIGDTVRFTNKALCEIIITGRTKHFLSICGEHLSVDNMNQAISHVENELNIEILEFIVGAVKSGSHFAHRWYVGTKEPTDEQRLKFLLDEHLKKVNDDYAVERSAMLGDLELEVIPLQWFYDWQSATGRLNGQSKIPRVMKGEAFESWESFVRQKQRGGA